MTRGQLVVFAVGGFLLLVVALMATGIIPGLQSTQSNQQKASLSLWGVGDPDDNRYAGMIAKYREAYPNIGVVYRAFPNQETYEDALAEAFATGKAPDLFEVSNEAMPRYSNKIYPTEPIQYPLLQLQQAFPRTVEQSFATQGYTFALPYSIDTLALVYNKDMLGSAGFGRPPKTWDELDAMVPQLARIASGTIRVAAVALGGSEENIPHATDLLSALMLQSGAALTSGDGKTVSLYDNGAQNAMRYYVSFSNPNDPKYTWNADMPNALDAFAQEKVAMAFAYHADIAAIKAKNPYLNFGVAPLPQPKDAVKAVTVPRYVGLAAARQSPQNAMARDFILATATNPEYAALYTADGAPAALLSLLDGQMGSTALSIFAKQALYARSWRKPNETLVRKYVSEAIGNIVSGKMEIENAMSNATGKINAIGADRSIQ